MRQQQLQIQLDAAQAAAKKAKFQLEFMLLCLNCGRVAEADAAMQNVFAALDEILAEGEAA